jgi:hypothetical protein
MSRRPETDPEMDQKALAMFFEAISASPDITAVRGKGWIQFETEKVNERYRIAWAAVYPDKIRLTLLLYGSPIETIIFNGEKLSFLSHTGRHSLYTRKARDPDMESYIDIPVRVSELILILLGRLPLTGGEDIYFSPEDPYDDSSLSIIVVRDENKERIQHISLDSERKISCIQFRHIAGELFYEVLIQQYMSFSFGDIPVQLEVRDNKKRKLFIEITDFEPQTHIKDKVFQLTGPES